MESRSSGRSVRGSITSALTPCSAASVSAARSAVTAIREMPDDGHIGALARDTRAAELDEMLLAVRHLAADPVEGLVLDEDHGVLVADRRLEQALRVGGGGGDGDEQPGHVQEERLQAVRVGGAELVAGALGHAHDEWHTNLTAEHVVDVRGVVDDLVEREQREVDRSSARRLGADRASRRRRRCRRSCSRRWACRACAARRTPRAGPSVTLKAPPNTPMSSPISSTRSSRRSSSRRAALSASR